ncbi:MAG: nucleotidyltransferase domain-containing protein [Thermoplasmata archaeon]
MAAHRGGRRKWQRLDPPAREADRRSARRVAASVAHEFIEKGASAVVLGGSWARGDAHRESDIDLWVFGLRPGNIVLWRDPFMVTVDRRSEAGERRRLRTPPYVGGSVPGWRVAIALHDPEGVYRRLHTEARRFRWESIGSKCDRWVAAQVVGWAEEAVKLVRALATGNDATAAVQRDLLADHLGFVMAVHRRMFWDSENESWERISRAVGGDWARAQRRALGVPAARLEESCRGALALYALTARAVEATLAEEQRAIVSHTLGVIGEPRHSLPRGSAIPGGRAGRWRPVRAGRTRALRRR